MIYFEMIFLRFFSGFFAFFAAFCEKLRNFGTMWHPINAKCKMQSAKCKPHGYTPHKTNFRKIKYRFDFS